MIDSNILSPWQGCTQFASVFAKSEAMLIVWGYTKCSYLKGLCSYLILRQYYDCDIVNHFISKV